jgi:hypothetical protein
VTTTTAGPTGGKRRLVATLGVLVLGLASAGPGWGIARGVGARSPHVVKVSTRVTRVKPGERIRVRITNGTKDWVHWGGCLGWHQAGEKPSHGFYCKALVSIPPHLGFVYSFRIPPQAKAGQGRILFAYQRGSPRRGYNSDEPRAIAYAVVTVMRP